MSKPVTIAAMHRFGRPLPCERKVAPAHGSLTVLSTLAPPEPGQPPPSSLLSGGHDIDRPTMRPAPTPVTDEKKPPSVRSSAPRSAIASTCEPLANPATASVVLLTPMPNGDHSAHCARTVVVAAARADGGGLAAMIERLSCCQARGGS